MTSELAGPPGSGARADLLARIAAIVGPTNVLSGPQLSGRAVDAWCLEDTAAAALVRPGSTAEVSAVMELCHAAGQVVIAEGGRTNLVRGTKAGLGEILLSLERMNHIGPVDVASASIMVEAGAIVQRVQEAAQAEDLRFGVDFGARGSATIGGTLAMNAGGIQVLRYGSARAQVLGLEVVLADGTVIEHLVPYAKDNTGYDLKQLFIGSEGTLGIITRASLKLVPHPTSVSTAFLAFSAFAGIPHLLRRLSRGLAGTLSSFEVLWGSFYDLNTGEGGMRAPVQRGLPYYVLCEAEGFDVTADQERFERLIAEALEGPHAAVDAAIAQSGRERLDFWRIREDFEAEIRLCPVLADFDVSLGVDAMEAFGEALAAALKREVPEHHALHIFGHMGDGNLHIGIGLPDARIKPKAEAVVYGLVSQMGGAISAEHGIGLTKRAWLGFSRKPEEIALMRRLKAALDPKGILNPGKVLG
ncbi:FAD-binding oxidoreductase [Rhodoligotrophos defluvii]|uniref:FAD-binding oxidoreductase n=1 Tax=Rhodoligotrophos defluvii TaxID=2561934 RepID=UPI0010C9EFAE|nr:FAD-binding oxidoreductase [Rhodoligotrophos defluvii]